MPFRYTYGKNQDARWRDRLWSRPSQRDAIPGRVANKVAGRFEGLRLFVGPRRRRALNRGPLRDQDRPGRQSIRWSGVRPNFGHAHFE